MRCIRRSLRTRSLLTLATLFTLGAATSAVAQVPTRPVVVLPGILGSRLVDASDTLVWGGASSYTNFKKMRLPRDPAQIRLRPDGIIESIPIVWPWKIKQYAGLVATLEGLGYQRDENLFLFAYDWRRSNFETARQLNAFLREHPKLRGREIDIVAHSMGGVVATILIHEQPAGGRVRRLVTMGTPYFGSLNALETMIGGFDGIGGFLSEIGSSPEQVRSIMLSFESGYELLPSYGNCCILGAPDDPARRPGNLFRLPFWQAAWLTPEYANDEGRAFVAAGLERGRRFASLAGRELPAHVEAFLFAGDNFGTRTRIYLGDDGSVLAFHARGGDGTVWVDSAARDRIADSRISFEKHATIFDDASVQSSVRRILIGSGTLDDFAATLGSVSVRAETGETVEVDLVTFEAVPPLVAKGRPVAIQLELRGTAVAALTVGIPFQACVAPVGGAETCFALAEGGSDTEARRFAGSILPPEAGTYTVTIDQFGTVEDYFAIVESEEP